MTEKIKKLVVVLIVVAFKIATAQYLCDFPSSSFCSIKNQTISSTAPFTLNRNASYPFYSLVITDATMPKIPPSIFASFPTVTFFSTANNGINEISVDTFANCLNLATLMIRNDKLTSLPAGPFKACTNLLNLQLSNHSLTSNTIDGNAFEGLRNLTALYLTYNLLTSINPSWFNLPKLATLDLSYNRLTTLDESHFRQLPSLTAFYVQNNQISVLPTNLFSSLSKPLNSFAISNNKLTSARSVGASYSDYTGNQMTIFNLTSGEDTLHLSNNTLRRLNCPNITALTVRRFYAADNQLTNFLCIRDMKNLTDMNVTSNALRPTKTALKNLKSLRLFSIYNQKNIPTLKVLAFTNMTALMNLYVDGFKSFKTVRKLIPQISVLGVSTRSWTCTKTFNVSNTLAEQKIRIYYNYNSDRILCNITQPRF